MSEIGVMFLNNIFAKNIVFISFLGIVLLFVEARGLRKSFKKGLKFSLALLISLLLGWIVSGWFGSTEVVSLVIFWLSSLVSIYILCLWGELKGEWLGIPRLIIALAPFFGSQWLVREQGVAYFDRIYPILGITTGFYLAFVLTAAVREQIKISEIPDFLKEKPLLLVSLSVFALALIGFAFN